MKNGFTFVEVLISTLILSIVVMLSVSIMLMINATLFDSQTESQNRINLSDSIFFITREIQSAEKIIVSEKSMKIKQFGSDSFNLEYEMIEGHPFGCLNFKGKKMLDIDYQKSHFSINGNSVKVVLAVLKNNLGFKQEPKIVSFSVAIRSEGGEQSTE